MRIYCFVTDVYHAAPGAFRLPSSNGIISVKKSEMIIAPLNASLSHYRLLLFFSFLTRELSNCHLRSGGSAWNEYLV